MPIAERSDKFNAPFRKSVKFLAPTAKNVSLLFDVTLSAHSRYARLWLHKSKIKFDRMKLFSCVYVPDTKCDIFLGALEASFRDLC